MTRLRWEGAAVGLIAVAMVVVGLLAAAPGFTVIGAVMIVAVVVALVRKSKVERSSP